MNRTRLIRLHPRPDSDYVSQNRTVLSTGLDGFIKDDPDQGFYVHQTQMLSKYKYTMNDTDWYPVAISNVEQHSWLGYYIQAAPWVDQHANPDRGSGQVEPMSQETIELRLSRFVGLGVHEDVDLTNFSQKPAAFELRLEFDGDFIDQLENDEAREQKGTLNREWRAPDDAQCEYFFDYHAENHFSHQGDTGTADIHRGLALRFRNCDSPPAFRDGRIIFNVTLPPHGKWHACVHWVPFIQGLEMEPLYPCGAFYATENVMDVRRELFLANSTHFSTPQSDTYSHIVSGALEQAKSDLASLRLYDLDRSERQWTVAAGLPLYIALFGRDTLTVGWHAAIANRGIMPGTLQQIANLQGTKLDNWRDEEPGKMLHESHTGPLASLRCNPRGRYYGSATTSKFFPVVLVQLWHWTGDKSLVEPFIEPALRAIQWMDTYGDFDHDGFYEYQTRSEQGTVNQGWKDSRDAIVWGDGSQVRTPITTCEEQSYGFGAKLFMSELLWWLGRKSDSVRLFNQAQEMKKRFHDAFWWPQENFYYMGLGPGNRPIDSVGSNVGHLLAAGIVDSSLARTTADRLMRNDLYTGWGLRTLSSDHPAYNPYSYHRGSVWPVEHGTIALGMMRYGFHDYVQQICRGMFEAAAMFDYTRLPEVFSGHQRDQLHPFPALYPKTNWPQAWSSSAIFVMVQAMLGLYPYAPLNMLIIDPHLPEWLPELTLENLHVANAVVAIRFYRRNDGTSDYEVLDKRGTLHIVRQPSPWSQTDGFVERIVDLLTSFLPGH